MRSTEWWLSAIRKTPRGRRPTVLCLHDVRDAEWLERFVATLSEVGEFVDLDTFMSRRERGTLTGQEWVITLDDGERSLLEVVHPVLSDRDIPYAAFVITDVLLGGEVPWFYRFQALRHRVPIPQLASCWGERYRRIGTWTELTGLVIALPWPRLLEGMNRAEEMAGLPPIEAADCFLTASEVATLSQSPLVTIGAHTHRHPILANLSPSAQCVEIRTGVELLTSVLGSRPRYFAYPSGRASDFDEASVDAVRACGFHAAFTTNERPYCGVDGVYRIPRIGVMDGMSVRRFGFKLAVPWNGLSARREGAYQRTFRMDGR